MKQGQRVIWNDNGSEGTVLWVTNRGGFFAVEYDDGEYVEYADNCVKLFTVIE